MQEIQHLNDKLDTLLKKYSALATENGRLLSESAMQERTIASLQEQLKMTGNDEKDAEIGKSVVSKEEKDKMRKQIDTVIGEIDKILNTLDD